MTALFPHMESASSSEAELFETTFITPLAKAMHATVGNFRIMLGQKGFDSWKDTPEIVQDAWKAIAWYLSRNPAASVDAIHDAWCEYKVKTGWKAGEKNVEAKTHPMLIPLDQCPETFVYRYVICQQVFTTLTTGWAEFNGDT